MKFKQYLTEKYLTRVPFSGQKASAEVFINPTRKEIQEAGGDRHEARGFADIFSKNVWVWDARVLHDQVFMKVSGIPKEATELELDTRRKVLIIGEYDKATADLNWIKFLEKYFPGWKLRRRWDYIYRTPKGGNK